MKKKQPLKLLIVVWTAVFAIWAIFWIMTADRRGPRLTGIDQIDISREIEIRVTGLDRVHPKYQVRAGFDSDLKPGDPRIVKILQAVMNDKTFYNGFSRLERIDPLKPPGDQSLCLELVQPDGSVLARVYLDEGDYFSILQNGKLIHHLSMTKHPLASVDYVPQEYSRFYDLPEYAGYDSLGQYLYMLALLARHENATTQSTQSSAVDQMGSEVLIGH